MYCHISSYLKVSLLYYPLSLEALNFLRQDLKIFKKQFVGVSVIPTFRNISRCMVSNKSRVLKNECSLQ